MRKYDLTDLGFHYKGAATAKFTNFMLGPWKVIEVPFDVDVEVAKEEISRFLNKICALEIPTSLRCNLRCSYCYIEDPRMKNKDVSKNSVNDILKRASTIFPKLMKENVTEKEKVHVSPWGAEPFMNIDTLETVYEFCHNTYGKGKYMVGTSTNGTIWSDRISNFFTNLIKDDAIEQLQISLDGPPEVHDRYRRYANGNPSFKDIEKFTFKFRSLMASLGVNKKIDHFCSTIHLTDKFFPEIWRDTADFFSTPDKWWSTFPFLPMRMSGENMDNNLEIERFIKAQFLTAKLSKSKQEKGIKVVDFYTARLFGEISCKSKNAFPYCSAMNTQIGVDIDGSMYPCHGAITTPTYKPFLWFGNIFDGVLSYQKIIRNIHYQFGSILTRAKCSSCPVYNFSSGNICWSCAAHNLAMSGNPLIDNINKCIAYSESFKYWVQIAKMNINNPILDEIPIDVWFGNGMDSINPSDNLIESRRENMHYDRNYDGFIMKAIDKFTGILPNDNIQYVDEWWKMDNYLENVKKGS